MVISAFMQVQGEQVVVASMERVLVVDDYPDSAEVICTLIRILGHDSRAARSGKDALEIALAFDPALVILDLELPDVSGYDVARELRRWRGPALHITALTGWNQPERRMLAFAAGCDDYILKPADEAKVRGIVATMRRLAARRQQP
ncbi:hypothetical protein BH11MYX3_BH11MYX3_44040 [soil metagenome]